MPTMRTRQNVTAKTHYYPTLLNQVLIGCTSSLEQATLLEKVSQALDVSRSLFTYSCIAWSGVRFRHFPVVAGLTH